MESFGWYGLILAHKGKAYIVSEDSQGFFGYAEYETELAAKEAWQHVLAEYEKFTGTEEDE